jgi:hypothetical protein
MDPKLLDELQQILQTAGADAAIDRLCAELKQRKDFHGLFYALLMKKRHTLGVSPVPTGSNQDLPADTHEAFEEGIREAARTAGRLCLDEGNIPQAWAYFRMLGEPGPVAEALKNIEPKDDQDLQPLIEIALHHGVLPEKGYDWVIKRYGICSAITTLSGELPLTTEARATCIRRLVRALHNELLERLKVEIARQQNFEPSGATVAELIAGRDWLFADDFYHIDLSHLNSTVQMATQLDQGEELHLARDLCAYGKRLSPRFRFQADPPFEDQYTDYDRYLAVLSGEDVEGGIAHFRAKAETADPQTIGTFPAEVLVNLLLRIGCADTALEVSRKLLAPLGDVRLSCPSFVELCQRTGNYGVLAEVAREQGNAINFVAGLIAAQRPSAASAREHSA